MKRTILLLLILSLILGTFSSCGHKTVDPIDDQTSSSPSEDTSAESITEELIDTNQSENTETDDRLNEITDETTKPSSNKFAYGIYYFRSFNELKNYFTDKNSLVQEQKNMKGQEFLNFVELLTNDNGKILRPLYNGEPMAYDEQYYGVDGIVGWCNYDDMHGHPCIYYNFNKQGLSVYFTYLDEVMEKDFSTFDSTLDIFNEIAIDYYVEGICPEMKNAQSIDIEVNGKVVSAAAVIDTTAKGQTYGRVEFYYDGMYIAVECREDSSSHHDYPDLIEFLKGFSMG